MDLLSSFARFLKKLWNVLRKVLAVALLLAAVYFFVFATIANAVLYGILCFGAAFLVDADTAQRAVEVTGDALGQGARAVADAVGDIAGGAAGGLLSSGFGGVLVAVIGGYLGYRWLTSYEPASQEEAAGTEDRTVPAGHETSPSGASV